MSRRSAQDALIVKHLSQQLPKWPKRGKNRYIQYNEQGWVRELSLRDNQLTQLPLEVCQLSQLRRLDLFNNRLTSLPAELSQPAALQTLSLGTNLFTSLPQVLGQLTTLQ